MLDERNAFRQDINYAFLSDRLVVEAIRFLEKRVATPSTLFALNSLVQAIILHDQLVVGLASMVGAELPEYQIIREKLGDDVSPRVFAPNFDDLNSNLMKDTYYWLAPTHFSAVESTAHEVPMLTVLVDFLHIGTINDLVADEDTFCERFGVKKPFAHHDAQIEDQQAFNRLKGHLITHGRSLISPNDLLSIRDQAGLVAAGVAIGKVTGRDFYHALHERPLVANEMEGQGPKRLVQLMESELYDGSTIGIEDIDIPPFLGMIMSEREDWLENFWELVLELRRRHVKFRNVYGDFQIAWRLANRGEQRILKRDYDQAWSALLEKENYRCEQRFSHATLQALLSAGKSIAKSAIELDRFDQAICRVGGLVRLWGDMNAITSQHNARNMISRKCNDVASELQWREVVQGIQWAQRSIESARG